MDESTNELYFKPVGDSDHSHARLMEIRFPASSGVAGWVASNKMMLNIKNAYKDARFNSEIDKKTGFRTRTILCHPVLSSTNRLLGVIQMVNKKKSDPQVLNDKAKKKGYQSSYEFFSVHDEDTLGKCCVEVSKPLQQIFAARGRKLDQANKIVISDEAGVSPLKSAARSIPKSKQQHDASEGSDQSTEEDSYIPDPPPRSRDSRQRRRSSVGELSHFVKRNSINNGNTVKAQADVNSATHSKGIAEAVLKFQYRSQNFEKLKEREHERRNSDSQWLIAEEKRKRMQEYGASRRGSDLQVNIKQT